MKASNGLQLAAGRRVEDPRRLSSLRMGPAAVYAGRSPERQAPA
jgi:hypothetical protein